MKNQAAVALGKRSWKKRKNNNKDINKHMRRIAKLPRRRKVDNTLDN